uniref:Tetratricopeptide repeat protein 21A/21B fourth ARM domain-containing protein n=1 Tax=Amphimedon queenslandica TaxID=400682 RepID=A0A1X7SKB0_AMPQE
MLNTIIGSKSIPINAPMTCIDPEQAIAVFEKALKKTPSDAVLTSKVGNAYIKMHNFNKAVSYYEASLKNIDNSVLKCELAQLYTKLQKFDQAERILLQSLVNKQNDDVENNLELLRDNVSYCRILVKVYLKTKRYHEAIETLEKTRKYQTIIVKKVIVNEPDSLANEKETLANILHQLAKEVINVDNQMSPKAEIFYKEAVENCPNTALGVTSRMVFISRAD